MGWYRSHCKAEVVLPGSALSSKESVAQLKAWAASKLPDGPTLYPKSQVGRAGGAGGAGYSGSPAHHRQSHCCRRPQHRGS